MSRTVKLIVATSIVLGLLLLLTDPRQLPSVVLILPFLLLFLILSLTAAAVSRPYIAVRSRRLRMSFTLGAFPVLLLVLQSLGQLTVRDTLAILALSAIAYFYISRFGVRASH